jgi:cytochrome b6-f complex iron-sulfur subunit
MTTKKKEEKKNKISRKDFFKKVWIALGTLAGIEFLGISFNFLFHPAKNKTDSASSLVVAGNVNEFSPGTVTMFSGHKFYLSRLKDGGFLALSLTCTHLGCSVGWDNSANHFICPCHSSTYTITGEVISPPAPRALDLLPVVIENGIVKVDLSSPVKRQKFEKSQETYPEL